MCSHYTFTTYLASKYVSFSPSHLKKYICCDTVSYHHGYLISNWICSCLFLVFFWLCPQCEWKWGMQAWRECWEERKQPGWRVDWRIANRSQTGRNPCQLCLPTPPPPLSTSAWISGRHARWHSKFVTCCKDLQLCFHYFICHRFSGEYDTIDLLLVDMELITSVYVRLCAILIINFF